MVTTRKTDKKYIKIIFFYEVEKSGGLKEAKRTGFYKETNPSEKRREK